MTGEWIGPAGSGGTSGRSDHHSREEDVEDGSTENEDIRQGGQGWAHGRKGEVRNSEGSPSKGDRKMLQ